MCLQGIQLRAENVRSLLQSHCLSPASSLHCHCLYFKVFKQLYEAPKTSRFSFHFFCYISFKMFIPTLFPNVKGVRVRFGCPVADSGSLGPLDSSPPSHHYKYYSMVAFHRDWSRHCIKDHFLSFAPLLMPEAPTYALLSLSWGSIPLQQSCGEARPG